MRTRGGKKIVIWVVACAAVLSGVAFWSIQRIEVNGRVALRSWDGEMSVPQPARAMAYPRWTLFAAVRQRLTDLPAARAQAEASHAEALRAWREKSAARDEALRVLQVAERANSADLALCRERYDKAVAEAEEVFAQLERCAARVDSLADPAALLADLPGAVDAMEIGPRGDFVLAARVGQAPVILVLSGDTGGGQAWLSPVEALWGGRVEMEFTNENLLTMDKLRNLAGLPAAR